MGKLGFFPWFSVGLAIAAVIFSETYFYEYQPTMEDAALQQQQGALLEKNAAQLPAARKRRDQSIQMVNTAAKEWEAIVKYKTPPATLAGGGINMAVSPYQMTIDARVYRNSLQRAVNKQLKIGGVTLVGSGPAIPFPSEDAGTVVSDFFNYPAIPFPVVMLDLGQITVQGTYQQIKTNMEAWSNMPNYLAVADGLSLAGTAPILTGSYNVSIIGFIKGSVVYPTPGQGGIPATGAPGKGAPGKGGPKGRSA